MTSPARFTIACLLLGLAAPAEAYLGGGTKAAPTVLAHKDADKTTWVRNTNPILVPESDKLFFGKDYPVDERPVPTKSFAYPFPDVQHADTFDKDYVKDENADNGEWKAQTDYDFENAKYKQAAKEREEARRRYEEEHGHVAGADQAAADADAEWQRAQAEADAANEAKTTVDGKTITDDGYGPDAPYSGTGEDMTKLEKAIADAEARYKQAQENFLKCKQELEDAKAEVERIKALLAATSLHNAELHKKAAAEQAHFMAQAKEAHEKAVHDLDVEKAAVTATKNAADEKVANLRRLKDEAAAKAAKEKAEDEAAKKALEKEEADVAKAEKKLNDAGEKLRNKGLVKSASPALAKSAAAPFRGLAVTTMVLTLLMAAGRTL